MHLVKPDPGPKVIAGRYELGPVLGRGGMGEVLDGMDRRLGRRVAVKVLRADLAAEPDLRARFEAEARAAAGLAHPNVVAVHDTGDHEGVPYLVMERLPGPTLADEIESGPLSPSRVEGLARQVLAALEAAHRAGIVHRDIKPGNLLLTEDSAVKVADFGIAKAAEGRADDLTVTGQVPGTPAYVAPERLEGAGATARSDLYSLGVVLYEALSGVKPFTGDTPWGLTQAIMEGRHPALGDVAPGSPPPLVAAIERAMARRPEDRFDSASAMAAALDTEPDAAATVPAAPDPTERLAAPQPPQSVAGPAGTAPTRRRWRLALAAAAGVAVVVALLASRDGGEPIETGPGASDPPATTSAPAAGRALPEPLQRAVDRLEESVQP